MTESRLAKPERYGAKVPVRFADCDPAGIVFYPRYLEIGPHYPAMTAVRVVSLIEDQARVEIDVTAVVLD